jgi:predicted nucleic acid-binding protein
MRALLDINVLIALLDADHLMHAAAQCWLSLKSLGSAYAGKTLHMVT